MGFKKTKRWFEIALPEPTDEQACIQMGVHIEEVAEMMEALNLSLADELHRIADRFKACDSYAMHAISNVNRVDLLDSLIDQNVTAIGVCHTLGMDHAGALDEVNRSNFSKFEDGQPVFKNGKIAKGCDYTVPDLGGFV
jgi:predicted HAD superfamily Cof-like phosphohydrolase